jgi:hypothetical protein
MYSGGKMIADDNLVQDANSSFDHHFTHPFVSQLQLQDVWRREPQVTGEFRTSHVPWYVSHIPLRDRKTCFPMKCRVKTCDIDSHMICLCSRRLAELAKSSTVQVKQAV